MRKNRWFMLIATAVAVLAGPVARPDEGEAKVSANDLKGAKVTLEDALKASEAQGTPISAKYELEKGKLQLSVYTLKGDKYSELVVDHKTGKVAKTEAITEGDDYKDAKEQSAAMAKAKTTLRDAVAKAVAANKGSRAVSATPKLDGEHPVAEITLVEGAESHTVTQKLD